MLSFGLPPSGPCSPCCCIVQRRAGSCHIGGHAEKKLIQLGFSSETEPKGVAIYTNALWMLNFVYQKSGIQGYSINIIHLPRGHFLDFKSTRFTVGACPFLSVNRDLRLNTCRQQKTAAIWSQLIAYSKEKRQLWTLKLRSAYSHFLDWFHTHPLSCPLAQIQGYRKLAQTYLNQQASCRQHLSPAT